MDNLYGRPLLKRYVQQNIPDYKDAVIVSPDAGGAKRATAIADSLGMEFALIHKVRRKRCTLTRLSNSPDQLGTSANENHRSTECNHDASRQCCWTGLHSDR